MAGDRSYGLGNAPEASRQRTDPRQQRYQRQSPRRETQEGEGEEPPRERKPVEFLDLHIQQGLTDALVRVEPKGWETFLDVVVCGKEDVIFQAKYEHLEDAIKVHGDHPARWKIRPADMSRKLPCYKVIPIEEIRRFRIEQTAKRAS